MAESQDPRFVPEEEQMKKIVVRKASSVRLTAACGCCYSAFNF
jgi:hypothetical protein